MGQLPAQGGVKYQDLRGGRCDQATRGFLCEVFVTRNPPDRTSFLDPPAESSPPALTSEKDCRPYDKSRRRDAPCCWGLLDQSGSYAALRKIFDDGDRLPRTWQEWLKVAMEMEQELKAYGHVVMRVYIDPTTFPDWCAANGTTPGREGRKRFVAAAVAERYGEQT